MVRLFATDLDGTLLTHDRTAHPQSVEALLELQASGVAVCLASGRAMLAMKPVAEAHGFLGPVISANGAYVIDGQGQTVFEASVPLDATSYLLRYARENDVHANWYKAGRVCFTKDGPEAQVYRERTNSGGTYDPHIQSSAEEPTKVLFIDEPESILRHIANLTEWAYEHQISVVVSEPDYVEFLPPGVNKGNGLERLAHHLGLGQGEVAAIGDWTNDLEMVAWAGVSAAVGNAHPSVKHAASQIVATNDAGGVGEFARWVQARNKAGIVKG